MDENPYQSPTSLSRRVESDSERNLYVGYDDEDDGIYFASFWDELTLWNLGILAAGLAGPLLAWYVAVR